MKRLLALCLALCLSCSLTLAAAAEDAPAWKGFRGLDWGASKADVIALEGDNYSETASLDEATGLTGLLYTDDITVSAFTDAYLVYILGDRGLFMAGYAIDAENPGADFDYLESALTSLYGAPAPEKEAEYVALLNGFSSGSPSRITCWLADRTGILLSADDYGSIEIIYIGLDFFPDLRPNTTGL